MVNRGLTADAVIVTIAIALAIRPPIRKLRHPVHRHLAHPVHLVHPVRLAHRQVHRIYLLSPLTIKEVREGIEEDVGLSDQLDLLGLQVMMDYPDLLETMV
jgi:hypothetical protein